MVWTAPTNQSSGHVVTAAEWNKIQANLTALAGAPVVKVTTESVTSSTVLQNDDELFWTIGAAGTYIVELDLFVLCASGQTGDIKFGFTFPAGNLSFHGIGADVSLAAGTTVSTGNWQGTRTAVSGTTALSYGTTSTSTTVVTIRGLFVATAAGTLQLQWAQDVSNANAAQVLSGSYMHVRQVA